ncbi:RluA family pseudouridine synthase [Humisphaera borealis]|uniref:RluA family pseudouridine synthase n=1 Tax=Humisphaera borealis TaxID=2807512 RepID=A0A7M2WZ34_9BACT|nr:RluA family pseudouridine synthase [Humisphaera borealis]QOV90735.1 RluA family pseudouridine synthase [Humisphaera borealis]
MRTPPLEILRRTDDWVAVSKPAGLAVIPGRAETDSVLEALGRQLGLPSTGSADPRVRVVHRLDKETTGVLLYALNTAAQRHFCHQFQNNTIQKQYLAIVVGRVEQDEGDIQTQIGEHPGSALKMAVVRHGGRPARTLFRVEQRYRQFSLVRLFPKTGKTHQIRVHMAHLGHPLAIDHLYYAGRNTDGLFLSRFKRDYRPTRGDDERPLISRLPLHAESLAFTDLNGELVTLTAPPPKDMRAAINMLTKHG